MACRDQEAVTAALRDASGRPYSPSAPPLPRPGPRRAASAAERTARALGLWDEALPIPGTPAQAYLAVRSLPNVASAALRFHPACPHPSGRRLPAMVAAVRVPTTGALLAVHRTYLRPDGSGKAAAEPARATLGPAAGGAVKLGGPLPDAPLVIAEGIETALSAGLLLGAPAWAAVSAGNMARLDLPGDVRAVVVATDNDPPGLRAAGVAAHRWRAEGRAVRVALPDEPGADFNDIARARAAQGVADAA
jgi:phage/plasmid primase-like uncharacterized protein